MSTSTRKHGVSFLHNKSDFKMTSKPHDMKYKGIRKAFPDKGPWRSAFNGDAFSVPSQQLYSLRFGFGSSVRGKRQALIETLSDDLQLLILEFCDTTSVRRMMQVNHHYRDLIASEEAKVLWWEACHREWKWLAGEAGDVVDDLHIPIAAIDSNSNEEHINLALLLSMAAQKKATTFDESIFGPAVHPKYHFRNRFWSASAATGENEVTPFKLLRVPGIGTAVQFAGHVGHGDRCIRADQPLPRPALLTHAQRREARALPKSRSLLYRLSHLKKHRQPRALRPTWRPFVAPFVGDERDADHPVLHVTPRLVAYFEVSFLPTEEYWTNLNRGNGQVQVMDHPSQQYRRGRNAKAAAAVECVAVGLASNDFHLQGHFPGWDHESYGYQGDDGGFFHAGHALRAPALPFGIGDTVGCGLDYQRRAIFFTRNGRFLGYVVENMKLWQLQRDWYPVVGIDTNSPVSCNFGCDRPFMFDLIGMIEEQRSVLLHSMMIATASCRHLSVPKK